MKFAITFIGNKITGQQVATDIVFDEVLASWRIRKIPAGLAGLTVYFATISQLYFYLSLGRLQRIYITPSRSHLGFVRDIPFLLASFFGVEIFCHSHGSDFVNMLTSRWYSGIALKLYSKTVVITPSNIQKTCLRKKDIRCVCIENFVALSEEPEDHEKFKDARAVPVLLWNSNRMASKGFIETLFALHSLNVNGFKFSFVVLGAYVSDIELKDDEVMRAFEEFKKYDWINDIGEVSPHVADQYVKECDVVILPSRYTSECQPLSVISAMCYGKDLILQNSAALRETAGQYPVYYVESSLQNVIRKYLLEYKDSHVSNEQIKAVRERFSKNVFCAKLHAILNNPIDF